MVSPTAPLFRSLRRLALTTKMVGKGFYKGNRTGTIGRHTKHGGFIIDWDKVRTYVAPDMTKKFELKPFVTNKLPRAVGSYGGDAGGKGPLSGQRYLQRWKEENGDF
ncbi:mitochondrial ribosomal protein L27-domain-containing protein [Peziza echinospora]|nr:mitochondrial ribosomal protein L27-domain-containing protein [Peziza echinospora]